MVNKGGTDMWTRELLKRNAKEIFKRNYWTCVGVSLVLAAAVLLSEESEETTPVFLIIIMEVIIIMEILPEVL
jgi:hypothetical protein